MCVCSRKNLFMNEFPVLVVSVKIFHRVLPGSNIILAEEDADPPPGAGR